MPKKSKQELLQLAVTIRDERVDSQNSAMRVGGLFADAIEALGDAINPATPNALGLMSPEQVKVLNATNDVYERCIKIEQIDTIPAEAYYKRYNYVVTGASNIVVGKIIAFSDSAKGGYTQVFFTHFMLNGDKIDIRAVDKEMPHIYVRRAAVLYDIENLNIKKGQWSGWIEFAGGGAGDIFAAAGFSDASDRTTNTMHFAKCISDFVCNAAIFKDRRWMLLQQGFSATSHCPIFYYTTDDASLSNVQKFELKEIQVMPTGVKKYHLNNGNIEVSFSFDWDKYKKFFPDDLFRPTNLTDRIYFMPGEMNQQTVFIHSGFCSDSDATVENVHYAECIQNFVFKTNLFPEKRWMLLQQGWSANYKYPIFYFTTEDASMKNVQQFDLNTVTTRPKGVQRYLLDNGRTQVSFALDWDKFNKYFPSDCLRPAVNNRILFIPQEYIAKNIRDNKTLGSSISMKAGDSILLAGASFANTTNGWFELACKKFGLVGYNTAIGGTSILNDVDRIYDASSAKPHGSLFWIGGRDVFPEVKALVLMHVHNQDVFLSEEEFKMHTLSYYKTHKPTTYAEGFDYIIKQYQQWCAAMPTKGKPVSGGSVVDVQGSKECQILICSHWNASRVNYNKTSRQLADRYGLPYCAFDESLGYSKDMVVQATTNTDADNVSKSQWVSPTVLMARFTQMYNGKAIGKTEVVDGVIWGWHPQGRERNYDYGNPQEDDGFYYPNIQYTLSGIFGKSISLVTDVVGNINHSLDVILNG